jgi:REP element-mobilizing transposase RayT
MPRQARLDTPGALHHVMARGIERGTLFRGSEDREDFLSRLGILVEGKALVVYAWALMGNHFHLLVQSTKTPLSLAMRSLMTGYAGSFNRRHRRVGHLFQNRFKSVLCEKGPYFLELVRYIHLNPVRAKMVEPTTELRRSPLTGHSVLMGAINRPWQETKEVLSRFSSREGEARRKYEEFVEEGLKKGVFLKNEKGNTVFLSK